MPDSYVVFLFVLLTVFVLIGLFSILNVISFIFKEMYISFKFKKSNNHDIYDNDTNMEDFTRTFDRVKGEKENLDSISNKIAHLKESLYLIGKSNNFTKGSSHYSETEEDNDMDVFRASIIKEDFDSLNRAFYESQTSPETLLTKPLLLDVTIYTTQNMIQSFNRAREAMEVFHKNESYENLNHLEFLLEKAKSDFFKADEHAIKIGIPGLSTQTKRRARKSFNIVLDDSSTTEEKLAHWNKVLKIIREAGIKEEAIKNVNSLTIQSIRNENIRSLTIN